MSDRELLLQLMAVIEPIHAFRKNSERFKFKVDLMYHLPEVYVHKFADLFEAFQKKFVDLLVAL